MKKEKTTVLDEQELQYADLLESSGLSRSMARIIVCLMVRKSTTVNQIAFATKLNAASTGIVLKKLLENGMIRSEDSNDGSMSQRRYRPAGDWKYILAMIEEHERKKIASYREQAEKVRNEIKNKYGDALKRPR